MVTSDEVVARPAFAEEAEEVIAALGDRGVFHLRDRNLSGRNYVGLAQRLLDASRRYACRLVINARVDVAMTIGADGVQLGAGALEARDVRRIAPRLSVGVSVHSVQEAHSLTDVDWALFGHVFPTGSHPDEPASGLNALRDAAQGNVRLIAIGGITPDRVARVLRSGSQGVAVLSGIWREDSPKQAVLEYLSTNVSRTAG